jgi:hypothetical protein
MRLLHGVLFLSAPTTSVGLTFEGRPDCIR